MVENIKKILFALLISLILYAAIIFITIRIFPLIIESFFLQTSYIIFALIAFVVVFLISFALVTFIQKQRTPKLERPKMTEFSRKELEKVKENKVFQGKPSKITKKIKPNKSVKETFNQKNSNEILPSRISGFDELIEKKGMERGSNILLLGATGTGKTTFGFESLYKGALNGERGMYISLEEEVKKIKLHMKRNFGWDTEDLEKKGMIAFKKIDPTEIARKFEGVILMEKVELEDELAGFKLPFNADRIVFDSLSALELVFENSENFKSYMRLLFESLEKNNSVNFVLVESEQIPGQNMKGNIPEFLADGVVAFYNISLDDKKQNALEILNLRSSDHEKKILPYSITKDGIKVFPDKEVF